MRDIRPAPSMVVGIDGSLAATHAALWAVDEAVSRDIPLRLVYVINRADGGGVDDHSRLASGRAALRATQRAVEKTGQPVKVETDIVWGTPLTKLAEESRSAVMVCIGSMGMKHACHGEGSVASALPGIARCPVAVICGSVHRPATFRVGAVAVEANDDRALQQAFEEARLRGAPLQAIASWEAEAPDDIIDGNRLAEAQLNRRIARWTRQYPDVSVEAIAVRGSVCRYVAENAGSIQLLVSGVRSRGCDAGKPAAVNCSVLTVNGNHL
ncbi:universal stress protein [Mycobacterium branderi]|uniref:Universal stress protein n=1 Tax=Mycobacterium branderi TaxID=43348 RepID=A0A7I7W7G3_9MYCO|nr:hypothetical protein BST20_26450 [Mycobacterium branderi]BBZ12715.1 universal stress protein [Mycobacterium branderi]